MVELCILSQAVEDRLRRNANFPSQDLREILEFQNILEMGVRNVEIIDDVRIPAQALPQVQRLIDRFAGDESY